MIESWLKRIIITTLVVFIIFCSSVIVHEGVHVAQALMDGNADNIRFIFTWEKIYVVADYHVHESKIDWFEAESQAYSIQFLYVAIIIFIYCLHKDNKIDQLEERFI